MTLLNLLLRLFVGKQSAPDVFELTTCEASGAFLSFHSTIAVTQDTPHPVRTEAKFLELVV